MNMTETCAYFAQLAAGKARIAKGAPAAFFVGSMLAGAYVGIALILDFVCTAGLPAGVRPLVGGGVFGIGLILVVLAGAEMFTGHVMYETFGVARRTISLVDALLLFVLVWIGNLVGAALFTFIFVQGGSGILADDTLIRAVITKKETSPLIPLFCRAVLCNWLVCLAIWLAARLKNEAAKMIGIAWCLLAFVACGFEHSVANMTAVCLGLFAPHQIGDVGHAAYNLTVVTLGNLLGGGLFVAGAYMWSAKGEALTLSTAAPAQVTAVAAE